MSVRIVDKYEDDISQRLAANDSRRAETNAAWDNSNKYDR